MGRHFRRISAVGAFDAKRVEGKAIRNQSLIDITLYIIIETDQAVEKYFNIAHWVVQNLLLFVHCTMQYGNFLWKIALIITTYRHTRGTYFRYLFRNRKLFLSHYNYSLGYKPKKYIFYKSFCAYINKKYLNNHYFCVLKLQI